MSSLDTLIYAIEQGIEPDTKSLCVAYSGGLDSSALLAVCALLVKQPSSSLYQCQLSAVHVNHGLSKHAGDWQQHCYEQCTKLGVMFHALSVHIPQQSRTSLEAQARDARYAAINHLITTQFEPSTQVLLAQHQDDQIETFLLQLKRGSGVQGLASMPASYVSQHGVRFVRPWLNVPQTLLVDYAQQSNMLWIEDESNQNLAFDRNFLRQQIIPLLKQRWPSIGKTVARTAKNCQQQSALIHATAKASLDTLQANQLRSQLNIEQLLALESSLRDEVVRLWVSNCKLPAISHAQLSELYKVCRAREDAIPIIELGDCQIRRYRGNLYALDRIEALAIQTLQTEPLCVDAYPFEYQNIKIVSAVSSDDEPKYAGVWVNSLTEHPLHIVFGHLTLKVKLDHKRPSKQLKQWCKEFLLPPWQRKRVGAICQNDIVLAVIIGNKVMVNVDTVPKETEQSSPQWNTIYVTST